ncbi:hypothetical protein GKG42_06965 [Lactonifactor sp. BIOML-A2]|nr:hypothetical protein [Lactonifactor sp. BIOML-A2]MSB13387.1 hypothetical protein [Lactonifactor sp. BIOML-A6]
MMLLIEFGMAGLGAQEFKMKYEYENDRQELFESQLKTCPECGSYMTEEEEDYGLNNYYKDKWYECPRCGYCLER